ncbi:hypothetical protein CXF85_14645 [Colwellia sp. 75C3]|uniref:type IV pilus modification PilV family protein n=1 Tax=Colwellia sp. 75C3 TaxID=888425 RepID=UPI000C324E6A|nr:prepilin-type N-terminal cleavage/methylation domain-containing protein [Colwellia sp. 75C3]PKG82134.1 hypothetical protein CXF85_14645 [Colwellia sp. 75C3]
MQLIKKYQGGVGLIEVLVSMMILAVGLLSIGTLHSNIIKKSSDNKAQSEAMVIAQQRLEQLRNYSADITTKEEFSESYSNITNGNETLFTGTNASFTRVESIADANKVKDVTIFVHWQNRSEQKQTVSVNSSIAWQKPRSAGDSVGDAFEALIPSATGRAVLGAGVISDYDSAILIATNEDLMKVYKAENDDSLLVDTEGNVVLTLVDACDLDSGECTDFVRISGSVYIDVASQNKLNPGDIFVKASDAAYCQQYYTDMSGKTVELSVGDTQAMVTAPQGDYKYYHYTCYLGGGWHGNIGIILDGGISQKDKVCQGDPTSDNLWQQPSIAARRVYRGMTYKVDEKGVPVKNESGDIIYYSIGVGDAAQIPTENGASHDFVISSLNNSDTGGEQCINQGVMVRPDSNKQGTVGDLFTQVPTDFFCFNENSELVDSFDSSIFSIDDVCPFDPSDPPSQRHIITGSVSVVSPEDITELVGNMMVNTSDGSGNCAIGEVMKPSGGQYLLNYSCDVYDWGNGWNGYIQLNTDYSLISCTQIRENFSNISQDKSAEGYQCMTGSTLTISGQVSSSSNKVLTSAFISDDGGECKVISEGLAFSCQSDVFPTEELWSGTLTFGSSSGTKLCINEPNLLSGSYSILDGTSSTASITLQAVPASNVNLSLFVVSSNKTCQ